tara:strand:+ start:335 stop:715 length:381 start_codon:yes stop_codon:yes gene_type:complete
MSFEITDETKIDKLVEKKEELICEYSKKLINVGNADNTPIVDFKKELLSEISNIKGNIDTEKKTSSNLNKLSDPYFINNNINNKSLTGTQLKKDIYEENTKLTMHLIYYVLGMGFMGYYIIKLLKK